MGVQIEKALATVEDFAFGFGAVVQKRLGELITLTRINGGSIPFDETTSVSTKIQEVDDRALVPGPQGEVGSPGIPGTAITMRGEKPFDDILLIAGAQNDGYITTTAGVLASGVAVGIRDVLVWATDQWVNVGPLNGSGQLLGLAAVKAIAYLSQSTTEHLTVPANTNGYSVDSLVIESSGSLTLEDGAVYKIL